MVRDMLKPDIVIGNSPTYTRLKVVTGLTAHFLNSSSLSEEGHQHTIHISQLICSRGTKNIAKGQSRLGKGEILWVGAASGIRAKDCQHRKVHIAVEEVQCIRKGQAQILVQVP